LGYETEIGLGLRGSWWHFNQTASESALVGLNSFVTAANPMGLGGAIATLPGGAITASIGLLLDVYYIDIRQRWDHSCSWWVLIGGGVRYAQLTQDYSFNSASPALGPTGAVNFHQAFHGVGPTLSFEIHHSLHDSGIGLYATGRGSVLFGT